MSNNPSTGVRVRIAPSPSGYVHVGTARTAIFNYLFARHHGGKFLIRIEDTDPERSKQEYIDAIINAMAWLGMESDEPIIYQSQRIDIYAEYAQKILESGHGYRCFCSKEQLAADRKEAQINKKPLKYNRRCLEMSDEQIQKRLDSGDPFTVRIKIPDGDTTYDDIVSGHLSRNQQDIEDFIIARSDGSATYNLAVVVDDHLMEITHVIRGNDHITNTFKQICIYNALGFKIPEFAHVPLILRPDKKKVSKRLKDKDVIAFQEEGLLPEAMFNYLCLLGWSPKTDREIYSEEELTGIFVAENFNASNAIFDEEKLLAFNANYIVAKSDHELAALAAPLLVDAGLTSKYWLETRWEYLRSIMGLFKPRMKKIADIVDQVDYFFTDDFKYDPEAAEKRFKPETADQLEALVERFAVLAQFSKENIEKELSELTDKLDIKKAVLIHPTRLAVSGRPHGPGLYEMLEVIGSEKVVSRMQRATDHIRTNIK